MALCLSGGGSRAAYLGEQVLEQLHRIRLDVGGRSVSLLDEVDYISGVSGGSLPAAYHAAWWPFDRKDPQRYFARFRKTMATDIQGRVFWSMTTPRGFGRLVFTKTVRTDYLARYFHQKFLGGATFGHLRRHAAAGLAPVVMLNAIIYDAERFHQGRKFVFTTLKSTDFHLPTLPGQSPQLLGRTLGVVTPDDLGLGLDRLQVARGVAASAAFPVLLAPLRIRDERAKKKRFIMLGDGGIYDNLGLETATQRLQKVLRTEAYSGALLIVVNAEQPYRFRAGMSVVGVISALTQQRARTLSQLVLRGLRRARRPIHTIEIALRKGGSSEDVTRRLAKIPTNFHISIKNQRLVEAAVARLFRQQRAALVSAAQTLARRPTSPPSTSHARASSPPPEGVERVQPRPRQRPRTRPTATPGKPIDPPPSR